MKFQVQTTQTREVYAPNKREAYEAVVRDLPQGERVVGIITNGYGDYEETSVYDEENMPCRQ